MKHVWKTESLAAILPASASIKLPHDEKTSEPKLIVELQPTPFYRIDLTFSLPDLECETDDFPDDTIISIVHRWANQHRQTLCAICAGDYHLARDILDLDLSSDNLDDALSKMHAPPKTAYKQAVLEAVKQNLASKSFEIAPTEDFLGLATEMNRRRWISNHRKAYALGRIKQIIVRY